MRGSAVSIVITNHDYGRFLRQAIDSALGQTYPQTEVVVVDDGSTDDSRETIAGYGERVVPVLKANGGQASALNAGFAASRGDVFVFLDADDALLPEAAADAVAALEDGEVAKAQWPLWVIDGSGRRTGEVKAAELPEGDLRDAVRRRGPASALPSAPTSGNAWPRAFLERVMPIPEDSFRLCADSYLFSLAPALGTIVRLREPRGLFRMHGANGYQVRSFEEKLALGVRQEREQYEALRKVLGGGDVDAWRAGSWWQRIELAVDELLAVVPADQAFILADEDNWGVGTTLFGRPRVPFPERDGGYWGPPAHDDAAVAELERQRGAGVRFVAFAWPAFWWLDHYSGMRAHLEATAELVLDTERVVVYELGRGGG